MFDFSGNNKHILKDTNLQYQLQENGFVIIPFYTKEDIEHLKVFYNNITPNDTKGFQPTTYFHDNDYRIKASNEILKIAVPHIEDHLENYKIFMGSFIVKYADKNSELGVHQDMTLVDESKFMGINIWSPLCDTNEENGALYLIPKSHRLFPTYRAATIPNVYDKYVELVKKYMQPVYLKAGEAILFDNSIMHFSPINKSNEVRIATNVFITHNEAVITICYNDKEKNKIELFEQEDDFFTSYKQFDNQSNMLRPRIGKSIGFTDYNFPVLTPAILEAKYGKIKNEGWIQKIKNKLFSTL